MDAINTTLTEEQIADALEESLRDVRNDTVAEVTKMRTFHTNAVSTYNRRADNARKHCRNELAELDDEKHRLQQKFDADMRRIDAEHLAIKGAADAEIATALKLAAASKSALEALRS